MGFNRRKLEDQRRDPPRLVARLGPQELIRNGPETEQHQTDDDEREDSR
jgi:hypothetical protein